MFQLEIAHHLITQPSGGARGHVQISPDHSDYLALRERGLTHTRASVTIARKLARRAFHTLRSLGEEAIAPAP
jgi:hypothetical protein